MNCSPMAKFGELFKWCFVHFPSQWTVRIESEHENAEPKIHHLILVDFLLFLVLRLNVVFAQLLFVERWTTEIVQTNFRIFLFFFLWKCSRLWPSSIKTGRRAIGHLTPGVPPSTSRTGRCDYANYHDEYHLLIYKNITYFISSASVCENNEHVFFLRFFFLILWFSPPFVFFFGGPAGTKFIRCRIYDRNLTILPMKLSSFCGHSVSLKVLFFVNSSRVNGIYGLKITRMKSRRPVWGLIHRLLSTVHQTYHVSKVSHSLKKKLYANRWSRPECISMFWVNIRGPQTWLWSNSFTTWPLQRN